MVRLMREWVDNCAAQEVVDDVAESFSVTDDSIAAMHLAYKSIECPDGFVNRRGPPLSSAQSKSAHHQRMGETPLLSFLMSFLYPSDSPQHGERLF